jgi:hypothetical protein
MERGVRRNGRLIAGDIHEQIDTSRTIAQQEGLSQACMDHIEKAEHVVPKMQATIEVVSRYVRQQGSQRELTQTESYARHTHLIPSFDLDRLASTRSMTEGELLRELAERICSTQAGHPILGQIPFDATTVPDGSLAGTTGPEQPVWEPIIERFYQAVPATTAHPGGAIG